MSTTWVIIGPTLWPFLRANPRRQLMRVLAVTRSSIGELYVCARGLGILKFDKKSTDV